MLIILTYCGVSAAAGTMPMSGWSYIWGFDGVLVIPKEIEERKWLSNEKAAGEKMVAEAIKNGMVMRSLISTIM